MDASPVYKNPFQRMIAAQLICYDLHSLSAPALILRTDLSLGKTCVNMSIRELTGVPHILSPLKRLRLSTYSYGPSLLGPTYKHSNSKCDWPKLEGFPALCETQSITRDTPRRRRVRARFDTFRPHSTDELQRGATNWYSFPGPGYIIEDLVQASGLFTHVAIQ